MNLGILIISIFVFIVITIFLLKLDSINLKNRILPFIDPTQVKKSSLFNLNLKLNLFNKFENTDTLVLIDTAEFADLFAVALTSGLNPRSSLEKIVNFVSSDFSQALEKALKENSFGKPRSIRKLPIFAKFGVGFCITRKIHNSAR